VAGSERLSFDLVVATVDRTEELRRLFASLERQTYTLFRVLLVDQNDDERLEPVCAEPGFEIVRLRSGRGLSHARNAAVARVDADVVCFPDDDCVYPEDLLERVARRLRANDGLDGLTLRGGPVPPWKPEAARLKRDNLWNRAISYTIFLRRELVARIGEFDEQLGLPASSAEEIDYLIRALDAGARIEYDPSLVVVHESQRHNRHDLAKRDGLSVGYILRKHRYPLRTVARMLVRPAGGAVLALARRDRRGAGVHASTLRGRWLGYKRAAIGP
jgi:GT2 family glycosyltransferase